MANRWGISKDVEEKVRARDKSCVYCGRQFSERGTLRKTNPSWEHIVNDIRINEIDNIALCCISCNASKGAKQINDWLKSSYCRLNGISVETVAQVVKNAILTPPKLKE